MKLQTKLWLTVLPLVLASVGTLGALSFVQARQGVLKATYIHLDSTVDAFVRSEVGRREALLARHQLSSVAAYRQSMRNEVLRSARQLADTTAGDFLIFDASTGRIQLNTSEAGADGPGLGHLAGLVGVTDKRGHISADSLGSNVGVVFSVKDYPPWKWRIAFAIADDVLQTSVEAIRNKTVLVTLGLGTILTLLLSLATRIFILGPTQQLSDAAKKIRGHERIRKIDIQTSDEFAHLARNMEDMAQAVEGYEREQRKWGQELERTITERTQEMQESKEQLELLLASAGEGFFGIDNRGLCTFVNHACLRLLGYSCESQLLGANMHERIHYSHHDGSPYEAAACPIFLTARQGEKTYRDDEVFWCADGSSFQVEYRSFPIKRGDELVGAVVTFSDITERKENEAVLRRIQKMDAVGQLTGGIAHDFNNILGIILGNLDLLRHYVLNDEKAHKRLDTIRRSAQRAANLTSQLLGFSRREATEEEVTDIGQVIAGMQNLIAGSLTPEVAIEFRLADPHWLTEIDPGDFQDALLNLVLNARDAMPRGGKLTLETHNRHLDAAFCAVNRGAESGEHVELSVTDRGDGIAPELLERIFEPFFTTKPAGKGTGLGLAMVFGFVKRSGGYITVDSKPGEGTGFHIYLPRSHGRRQTAAAAGESTQVLPHGNETILVVDDEQALLDLAQTLLEELGYRVLTATNGQRALQILSRDSDIDLLFTDVVMPEINGYELAERAVRMRPGIHVLLTSGYTDKADVHHQLYDLGYGLVPKPYSQSDLARRLRQVLSEGAGRGDPGTVNTAVTAPVLLQWTERLSVGAAALDDDHRVLLALLNRANASLVEGDLSASLGFVNELCDYTNTHFLREEAVMEACAYPGLNNHRQVHELLARKTHKLRDDLHREQLDLAELTEFLSEWWVDHIQCMDAAYSDYCRGRDELVERTLAQLDDPPVIDRES